MKSYQRLAVDDNRPVDVWGKPIGKPYMKKEWDQLTPEEMMADFDWKNDILDAYGERIDCDTFYQDYLFRELYHGGLDQQFEYKVLVTEYDAEANKVHKIDVEDIQDYLHLNDVALSPCLFYGNWRRKKLLNYVAAFVLDIDKLRPKQLQRFFQLFEEGRLLMPTFIANSGSGVHFYYLLDHMWRCDSRTHEANSLIATEIYRCLYDDVIKKEKYVDAQRHWIGQDYRVVNSRTKLNQVAQIYKVGDSYSMATLISRYQINVDRKKMYATRGMVKYANSIARELKIETPDFSSRKETHDFITANKDAAYESRMQRRQARIQKRGKKVVNRPVTWYKNTLAYLYDRTKPGYRFSSMKALAIIAYKEKVPRDDFLWDLDDLAIYWDSFDWKGDDFNRSNVEAIVRLYDHAAMYGNTSAETLEEWLGTEFRRIGCKRNGRSQGEHLERARKVQKIDDPDGSWRNKEGRPSAEQTVRAYREKNPDARKVDCIRDTGLSKPTVYKWWSGDHPINIKKPVKPVIVEKKVDEDPFKDQMDALNWFLSLSPEERERFKRKVEEFDPFEEE